MASSELIEASLPAMQHERKGRSDTVSCFRHCFVFQTLFHVSDIVSCAGHHKTKRSGAVDLSLVPARTNSSLITSKGHRPELRSVLSPPPPHSLNNGPVRAGLQALMRAFGIKQRISTLLTFLCAHCRGPGKARCQSRDLLTSVLHEHCLSLTFPRRLVTCRCHEQEACL